MLLRVMFIFVSVVCALHFLSYSRLTLTLCVTDAV